MVLLYFFVFYKLQKRFISKNWIIAVVGFVAIFLLGYYNVIRSNQSLRPDHIIHQTDKFDFYTARIVNAGEERAKTLRYEAEVERYYIHNQWKNAKGRLYLYVNKDETLRYGDELLIKGSPQTITPPQNPGEFNYKRFLSFKNIYHQHFLRAGDFQVTGHDPYLIFNLAYDIRAWASDVLTQNISSARELSIVQALVLGVKDDLADDTQQAYAASGAIHVLAVSGLHVGIIYSIIFFLLKGFQNHRKGKWLVAGVCLLVLWSYAMITGFSPSVLRAVTMFTIITIAQTLNRDTNIYNTLAASAFILLLFDPFLIMSLGFQLSFLAVLGIVYVQPKLYALILPENIILDKIWALTSVALAAQLATVPLCLLYFHQFPTYFFLSNLVVIPGATLVLCLGISVIALSLIEVVAAWLGWLLKWCTYAMNEVVFATRELPFSQITDVRMSAYEAALIFSIIILFLIFFHYKKLRYAWFALTLAVVFSAFRLIELYNAQDKIVFYKINKHTAIDFMSGQQSFLFSDSTLFADASKLNFHIKPNHLNSNTLKVSRVAQMESPFIREVGAMHLASWNNLDLVILDKPIAQLKLAAPLKVDYVVVCKEFDKDLAWINKNFIFDMIILDGSLSWYRAGRLKDEAEKTGISYYSVYHEGAYEVYVKS